MFNELVESVAVRQATNKRWGFVVSLTLQAACLLTLILIPLIYTQALPKAVMGTFLVAPSTPAPAAPNPPPVIPNESSKYPSRVISHGVITEPTGFPRHPKIFPEPPMPPENDGRVGVLGGDGDGGLLSLFGDDSRRQSPAVPAPPPTQAQERTQPQRIQKGGDIQAAQLMTRAQPVYPVLARQSGIQGVVVLHAIIDRDGRVSELRVISGHPLLVKAAIDAVNQWRYQPTLLNGQPVEVETTITVSFVLGG